MCERLKYLSDEELVKTAFTDEASFCLGKLSILLPGFKGTDRLCMVVELSMQCCGQIL